MLYLRYYYLKPMIFSALASCYEMNILSYKSRYFLCTSPLTGFMSWIYWMSFFILSPSDYRLSSSSRRHLSYYYSLTFYFQYSLWSNQSVFLYCYSSQASFRASYEFSCLIFCSSSWSSLIFSLFFSSICASSACSLPILFSSTSWCSSLPYSINISSQRCLVAASSLFLASSAISACRTFLSSSSASLLILSISASMSFSSCSYLALICLYSSQIFFSSVLSSSSSGYASRLASLCFSMMDSCTLQSSPSQLLLRMLECKLLLLGLGFWDLFLVLVRACLCLEKYEECRMCLLLPNKGTIRRVHFQQYQPGPIMSKFVPLRHFIYDRLYSPAGGYFCRKDYQVGELSSPIDFKKLIGFDDYQSQLFKRYPKNAWLTPSQIFRPYYGMSIGNYIEQAQSRYRKKHNMHAPAPIRIVQAGAGTGSAAESIIFYFMNNHQELVKSLQYHIVEISPTLCEHAERKLRKSFPYLFERSQIKIYNKDILKYSNPHRCYTIFLEVLDNLPHDKVLKNGQTGCYDTYSVVNPDTLEQKLVVECLELHLKSEKYRAVRENQGSDFITRVAHRIIDRFYKKEGDKQLYLPTQLLQLMKTIHTNMPKAHLIMSDFDNLISKLPGKNAPIVSFKGEASANKNDYDTYLVERGAADIFFPVDFHLAAEMSKKILGSDAEVVKSYEFFEQFGYDNWTQSRSSFNPLRQDFGNTSFLVTRI